MEQRYLYYSLSEKFLLASGLLTKPFSFQDQETTEKKSETESGIRDFATVDVLMDEIYLLLISLDDIVLKKECHAAWYMVMITFSIVDSGVYKLKSVEELNEVFQRCGDDCRGKLFWIAAKCFTEYKFYVDQSETSSGAVFRNPKRYIGIKDLSERLGIGAGQTTISRRIAEFPDLFPESAKHRAGKSSENSKTSKTAKVLWDLDAILPGLRRSFPDNAIEIEKLNQSWMKEPV